MTSAQIDEGARLVKQWKEHHRLKPEIARAYAIKEERLLPICGDLGESDQRRGLKTGHLPGAIRRHFKLTGSLFPGQ